MSHPVDILVLGAAYGLLPAVRLSLAGHRVTVLGRPAELQALSERGATVELLRRDGTQGRALTATAVPGRAQGPGQLGLVGAGEDPAGYDLAIFAMAEPQFAAPEIAALVGRIGAAGLPVLSIMNLPPASFLRRLPGLNAEVLRPAFAAWEVWSQLDPERVTATSPDAQAVRRDSNRPERLTVTLASSFKVAPFARMKDQGLLDALAADVEGYRPDGVPLPVRLVAEPSLHVPLAKWPMLITGNCRCLRADGTVVPISEAVRADLAESRFIYDWVSDIVRAIGAAPSDLVPFKTYAAAARSLSLPSSLARALTAGATRVERVDLMIALAGASLGRSLEAMDAIVSRVEARLAANRADEG